MDCRGTVRWQDDRPALLCLCVRVCACCTQWRWPERTQAESATDHRHPIAPTAGLSLLHASARNGAATGPRGIGALHVSTTATATRRRRAADAERVGGGRAGVSGPAPCRGGDTTDRTGSGLADKPVHRSVLRLVLGGVAQLSRVREYLDARLREPLLVARAPAAQRPSMPCG